jgi:hypothetical protein
MCPVTDPCFPISDQWSVDIAAGGGLVLGYPGSTKWRTQMARTRKPTDTVNLRLRLPEALRVKLTSEADHNKRSLNSEILYRLDQTFGEEFLRFVTHQEEQERSEQERFERIRQDPRMQEVIAKIIADMPKKEGR